MADGFWSRAQTDPWGALFGRKGVDITRTEDTPKIFQVYLRRLRDWLELEQKAGNIPPNSAADYYQHMVNQVMTFMPRTWWWGSTVWKELNLEQASARFPYWTDIMPDATTAETRKNYVESDLAWQAKYVPAAKEIFASGMAKQRVESSVLPRYQRWFGSLRGQGIITNEQFVEATENIRDLVNQGIPEADLPNLADVAAFETEMNAQMEAMLKQEKQRELEEKAYQLRPMGRKPSDVYNIKQGMQQTYGEAQPGGKLWYKQLPAKWRSPNEISDWYAERGYPVSRWGPGSGSVSEYRQMQRQKSEWEAGPTMPSWLKGMLEGYQSPAATMPAFPESPWKLEREGVFGNIYQGTWEPLSVWKTDPAKYPVKLPSGQQWTSLLPSQKGMLGAYSEAVGGMPIEDIEYEIWKRRTSEPPGIGSRQWRPARQWG